MARREHVVSTPDEPSLHIWIRPPTSPPATATASAPPKPQAAASQDSTLAPAMRPSSAQSHAHRPRTSSSSGENPSSSPCAGSPQLPSSSPLRLRQQPLPQQQALTSKPLWHLLAEELESADSRYAEMLAAATKHAASQCPTEAGINSGFEFPKSVLQGEGWSNGADAPPGLPFRSGGDDHPLTSKGFAAKAGAAPCGSLLQARGTCLQKDLRQELSQYVPRTGSGPVGYHGHVKMPAGPCAPMRAASEPSEDIRSATGMALALLSHIKEVQPPEDGDVVLGTDSVEGHSGSGPQTSRGDSWLRAAHSPMRGIPSPIRSPKEFPQVTPQVTLSGNSPDREDLTSAPRLGTVHSPVRGKEVASMDKKLPPAPRLELVRSPIRSTKVLSVNEEQPSVSRLPAATAAGEGGESRLEHGLPKCFGVWSKFDEEEFDHGGGGGPCASAGGDGRVQAAGPTMAGIGDPWVLDGGQGRRAQRGGRARRPLRKTSSQPKASGGSFRETGRRRRGTGSFREVELHKAHVNETGANAEEEEEKEVEEEAGVTAEDEVVKEALSRFKAMDLEEQLHHALTSGNVAQLEGCLHEASWQARLDALYNEVCSAEQ